MIFISTEGMYGLTSNRKGKCRGSRLVAWDKGEVQATPSGPETILVGSFLGGNLDKMKCLVFCFDAYLPRA